MSTLTDLFIFISLFLASVSLWMLAVGLKTFEALYMITVFEGFMIVSGSISGNVVLNEKEGMASWRLCVYAMAIGLILIGLYILLRGEKAGASGGRLLTRTMQAAPEGEGALSEMREVEISEAAAQESPKIRADQETLKQRYDDPDL